MRKIFGIGKADCKSLYSRHPDCKSGWTEDIYAAVKCPFGVLLSLDSASLRSRLKAARNDDTRNRHCEVRSNPEKYS